MYPWRYGSSGCFCHWPVIASKRGTIAAHSATERASPPTSGWSRSGSRAVEAPLQGHGRVGSRTGDPAAGRQPGPAPSQRRLLRNGAAPDEPPRQPEELLLAAWESEEVVDEALAGISLPICDLSSSSLLYRSEASSVFIRKSRKYFPPIQRPRSLVAEAWSPEAPILPSRRMLCRAAAAALNWSWPGSGVPGWS